MITCKIRQHNDHEGIHGHVVYAPTRSSDPLITAHDLLYTDEIRQPPAIYGGAASIWAR